MTSNGRTGEDAGGAKAAFGFREVTAAAKAPLVRGVFGSVATRYDLMNDLMSGGLHRLWKAALVDWLRPRPGWRHLDVAGGTGDVAFRVRAAIGERGRVSVCDSSPRMLALGRDRAIDRGLLDRLDWVCGDAEALPFAGGSMDAFTIAFGLRNVTHRDLALAEARRVLKPGGRFLCLEFSRVVLPLLGDLYDRYSFTVIPWLGQVVAGDRAAYAYLVESIRRFPAQAELAEMIATAGLGQVEARNMTGGVVALHSAWKI